MKAVQKGSFAVITQKCNMTFLTRNFDHLTPLTPKFPNLATQILLLQHITINVDVLLSNINVKKTAVYTQVNGE